MYDHTKYKEVKGLKFLPLPENGKSVNIRILAPPEYICANIGERRIIGARCQELGTKEHFWLHISSIIYKGMLSEFKKANIHVDDDLKCVVGCVFTIGGRKWFNAKKEFWEKNDITGEFEPPKTFFVALRKDLMNIENIEN